MAILTISRQFGSGGEEIGQALAEIMGYEYIDKKTILEDLRAVGPEWEQWGKDLDENCPTVWEKYDWSFRGFAALLQSCILDHVLKDKVVVMGRGANFLLEDIPSVLRVLITSPVEKRIDNVMLRGSIPRKTARRLIEDTDRDRGAFIRIIYGQKWDDISKYDMIIDVGTLSEDEIKKDIKAALSEKEKHDHNTRLLEIRARTAKIKAVLFTDPKLFIPTLNVFCDHELIVLEGTVHSIKENKILMERARDLAGEFPVRCELKYRK